MDNSNSIYLDGRGLSKVLSFWVFFFSRALVPYVRIHSYADGSTQCRSMEQDMAKSVLIYACRCYIYFNKPLAYCCHSSHLHDNKQRHKLRYMCYWRRVILIHVSSRTKNHLNIQHIRHSPMLWRLFSQCRLSPKTTAENAESWIFEALNASV
jgi:hypothetical protein